MGMERSQQGRFLCLLADLNLQTSDFNLPNFLKNFDVCRALAMNRRIGVSYMLFSRITFIFR